MTSRLDLHGHIIIPFGIGPESDVTLRLASTSPAGTDFVSDIPCVHMGLGQNQGIRFSGICGIFSDPYPFIGDGREAFQFARKFLLEKYKDLRPSQVDFLNLYFNCCTSIGEDLKHQLTRTQVTEPGHINYDWRFEAFLPMANAHLYLGLERDSKTGIFEKILVDILFWTGKRFVAVELVREEDFKKHLERTRTFLANDIEPGIIFEEEMKSDRENSLCRHLPSEILNFWLHCTGEPFNPLSFPLA